MTAHGYSVDAYSEGHRDCGRLARRSR